MHVTMYVCTYLCVQTGAGLWAGGQGWSQAEQEHGGLSADSLL